MPAFTYRAINEDNKEVRGQIDAVDMDAAKSALEQVHLDVVEINEASRSSQGQPSEGVGEQPVLKTTFAFEGTDSAKIVRRGTIQSETKHQAFERLKHDQKLFVTMLSPLGVTPQYRDNDLENWQKQEIEQSKGLNTPAPQSTAVKHSLPDEKKTEVRTPERMDIQKVYHPLVSTLRLYAGWLLAWYGVFIALGYYAHVRSFSWDIPFVEGFYLSSFIFSFIVAIFLFLLLDEIHRAIRGHWISRIVLGLLGLGAFMGVRMNIA